jgi:hypothetical protein
MKRQKIPTSSTRRPRVRVPGPTGPAPREAPSFLVRLVGERRARCLSRQTVFHYRHD